MAIQQRIEAVSALPVYRDRKLALLTDLYQLTMMYGHYHSGDWDKQVVFDLFYRTNPCNNGYVISAGLEQVVWYLYNLQFSSEDITYLQSLNMFSEEFLEKLRQFRFSGTLYAVQEGSLVFPNEPILRFEGSVFELQLIESAVLSFINHQSLIATKAQRIVDAARTDRRNPTAPVIEMGLRRAQNADASIFGARAAYIGGCVGTSNVMAGQSFSIPVVGTQGHSWIQSFPSELEAFRAYASAFPNHVALLVDTYDVVKSGIPNAIAVAAELKAEGKKLESIRIDSGDLAYLSKKAREMLDEAGLTDVGIIASSDLDEHTIRELILQGAEITSWGVGTNLITSYDCPALGAVYKMTAQQEDGHLKPTIKVSENPAKVTNPGKKRVIRLYNKGYASADLIVLDDEQLDRSEPLELFDPIHTYKRKTLYQYEVEEMLKPIFVDGELVYELPSLKEIRRHVANCMSHFPSEILRPVNPHIYHVDLSESLWDLKQKLLHQWRPQAQQG
ncbi:nicotinate phosphoribosyltransferase [Alicyclobacillus sp. SO9]|nr:nicotinate phosphoribosyltransferase [Alicyclobacillus sp. SO9]